MHHLKLGLTWVLFHALAWSGLCSAELVLLPALSQELSYGISEGEAGKPREQSVRTEAVLQFEASIGAVDLTGIARAEYDAKDFLEPGEIRDENRSGPSRRIGIGDHAFVSLREFYADYRAGDWDFRLGRQQVVWGDADGIKTMDILNPQSFREGFLGEAVETRIPLWSALVSRRIGEWGSVDWVVVPDLSFHDIPDLDALFTITSTRLAPERPENIPIPPLDIERPELDWNTIETGLRYTRSIGQLQGTVMAFRHFNDTPEIELLPLNLLGTEYELRARYRQTHSFGASLARPVAGALIRGETLYTHRAPLPVVRGEPALFPGLSLPLLGDLIPLFAQGQRFDVQASRIASLVAVELPVRSTGLVSFQYAHQELLLDDGNPPIDGQQRYLTALWRDDIEMARLSFELFSAYALEDDDSFVRLRLRKQLSDAWAVLGGADVFWGEAAGVFGQFASRDRLMVGIRWTPTIP